MTGLNKNLILLFLLSFFITSCHLWDNLDEYGYVYKGYIKNSTNETLKVIIETSNGNPYLTMDTTIKPNEMIYFKGDPEVNKDEDIVRNHLFKDIPSDLKVYVYRNDVLIVNWNGPANDMAENIHHFFNYKSWAVEFNNNQYTVMFSIIESDLTSSNK